MAKDASDVLRNAVGNVVREAVKNVGDASPKGNSKKSPFSGAKGIAAGAGLAAAAPLAKKGVDKVRMGGLSALSPTNVASKAVSSAGDKASSTLKDTVSKKVEEAGGAGGIAKEAVGGLLPGGGGGDGGGGKGGLPGVGKGRRMPIQQAVDVAVPIETAYNQFTQFEDWPQFMHRVTRVTQDDDCSINFATKIWGKTKEFKAEIETQRPDERIKWKVSQGITHAGVVTFHELAPKLTRIEVSLDVMPGSLLEKAARGMRHIKRAVRADLARYKAFIEMQEHETGAWRGVIEDGELVEPHDPEYDEYREYSDVEDLQDLAPDEDEDEEDEKDEQDEQDEEKDEPKAEEPEELPRDKTGRFTRGAGARSDREIKRSSGNGSGSGSGSKTKAKSSSSSSSSSPRKRSSSSSSRSRGASNGSSSSKRSSGTSSSRRRSSSRS
jgi:uncharacterized membrane protein